MVRGARPDEMPKIREFRYLVNDINNSLKTNINGFRKDTIYILVFIYKHV